MPKSKLIIAAAGSGKTTHIVESSLSKPCNENILITTYTIANAESIKQKFIEKNKVVPKNITIQPWFTFLLQHGVKPYLGNISFGSINLWDKKINGVILADGRSATHQVRGRTIQIPSTDFGHYFTKDNKIYTDKLAKFSIKCNESNGHVISRLTNIYNHIFIDEVQDFAGYDLDFLTLLINSPINLTMVGDPRQSTYSTSNVAQNSAYSNGNIKGFISDKRLSVDIDETSLSVNYRCCSDICDFSNRLYPSPWTQTTSGNTKTNEHRGVFLISSSEVSSYVKKYNPVQLRWNALTHGIDGIPIFNFGESKGLEFDRVLIYPTDPFIKWLQRGTDLAPSSKSKLYVALTRARYSIAIIFDQDITGLEKYIPTPIAQ